jgi:signal transduction histidine kinase
LDTDRLIRAVSSFKADENADIFLINRSGVIQTPSFYYGPVLQKVDVPVPAYSAHTSSLDTLDSQGHPIILGYAFISTNSGDTPFILMKVNRKTEMLKLLRSNLGRNVAYFFFVSVVVVLVIVILTATFLVNKIYESDSAKAETMQSIEQTSRLASIGRLSAGVAHEINNPLAVINEEAGYMRDMLLRKEAKQQDDEFVEHIDSILESVERCGVITKNLLSFSRQFALKTQSLKLDKLIADVLSFHRKEAEYRNVAIDVDVPEQIPIITTDTGKLQQILINLVNNAFQAVESGGRLEIKVLQNSPTEVAIAVSDNGSGISEENLEKVFEPFFTTKRDSGTGLGLSITYGLVRKLQGNISVRSILGEGTTFTVTLPVNIQEESRG